MEQYFEGNIEWRADFYFFFKDMDTGHDYTERALRDRESKGNEKMIESVRSPKEAWKDGGLETDGKVRFEHMETCSPVIGRKSF